MTPPLLTIGFLAEDDGILPFLFFVFAVLVILVVIVCWVIVTGYNTLQRLAQLVREARSNILVSLKKRQQLANQLIDIVQGYAGHERLVHLKVSQDTTDASMAAAYHQTNVALAQVGALAEKFPQLKADGTFRQLMADLQVIEGDLQAKRERYNACCREFNSRRNAIPTVLYAARFGFGEAPYLDFDGGADLDKVKDFVSDDGAAIQRMIAGAGQEALNRSRELGARLGQGGGQLLVKGRKLISGAAARAGLDQGAENLERRYWYLDTTNVRGGPVDLDKLAYLLAAGTIRGDSLVCAEGDEHWIVYSKAIPRLTSSASSTPPSSATTVDPTVSTPPPSIDQGP